MTAQAILFPSAAEGFIQGDEVGRQGAMALDQSVFRSVEGSLSLQDVEEIGLPLYVELSRKLDGFPVGSDRLQKGLAPFFLLGGGNQGVFRLPERTQDSLLVSEERLLLQGLLLLDVGADPA